VAPASQLAVCLRTLCAIVDVVERVEKFTRGAKVAEMSGKGVVGYVYVTGLEDWRPQERYELVWN